MNQDCINSDAQADLPDFWDERSEILNWANITYRYHRKRQWFFDLCDKVTQGASVIVGLVVVSGKTVADHAPLVGFSIAACGVLALVFGYADRKQAHKEIAEKARKLGGEIQPIRNADITIAMLIKWEGQRTEIDISEPPNLPTLVAVCEWEEACVQSHVQPADRPKRPCLLARLHMHFW
ncbi:hypothetical protein [Comamonas testosteroni]|uniref:hypothetical protein n=1 Tax=Comamonas testosteroni TaxID=285 RepID=UPI002DB652A9|nr:hypothetical protein [Comamonas testosteroni]MEB5967342.1 hypothetical protein [Comamonas testosteroni]